MYSAEQARLEVLAGYAQLDTPPERDFDDIARLAAKVSGKEIALMVLLDRDRQWFKAKVGLKICETPRNQAFCAHAIRQSKPLVVEDATRDPRFNTSTLVTDAPFVRFYAGVPLLAPSGYPLGTICVMDPKPGSISTDCLETLQILARQIVSNLELRKASRELAHALGNLKVVSDLLPLCALCKSVRNDRGYWQTVEEFMSSQSFLVSSGICPHCAETHFVRPVEVSDQGGPYACTKTE
jgi:GAF domain-containing protein